MTEKITAALQWNDRPFSATAINPGDYFGKAWFVTNDDFGFVVEADNETDAIDVFVDSEHGCLVTIDPHDSDYARKVYVGDEVDGLYTRDNCWVTLDGHLIRDTGVEGQPIITDPDHPLVRYRKEPDSAGNDCVPCDLENIKIRRVECKYYGPGIPKCGLSPLEYVEFGNMLDTCREFVVGLFGDLSNRTRTMSLISETWDAAFAAGRIAGFDSALAYVDSQYGKPLKTLQLVQDIASDIPGPSLQTRAQEILNSAKWLRDPTCHLSPRTIGGRSVIFFAYTTIDAGFESPLLCEVARPYQFTFQRMIAERGLELEEISIPEPPYLVTVIKPRWASGNIFE